MSLNEWDGEYTGRFILAYVTCILNNLEYVKEGYVILGIVPAEIFTSEQLCRRDVAISAVANGYEVYGKEQNNELDKFCAIRT